jgi:hypothetical protein
VREALLGIGSYSELKESYSKLLAAKFPATNLISSNLKKQSKTGREENAQRRIAEFCQYFSDVLLLNGEYDGEDHEQVKRVRFVHEALGIDTVNSGLICAAMSGRLLPEPEPEPEPEKLWL